jgi:hypothetical protein
MLDANAPVLEISDSDGFRGDLGHNDLTKERTGTKEATSAAALVLADKKDDVIRRTP